MKSAVILADGAFPESAYCLDLLRNAEYLVCCDGAAAHVANIRMPDAIVGDMDTLSTEWQKRFEPIIHRESEQETNDLCKAFRFVLAKGFKNIVILGATGKREDHTLGNLGHLTDFARKIPDTRIVTDHGEFIALLNSPAEVSSFAGQQISILSTNPVTEITSKGLKYPLNLLKLTSWWQGTLNEAESDRFTLEFTPASPLLLFKSR